MASQSRTDAQRVAWVTGGAATTLALLLATAAFSRAGPASGAALLLGGLGTVLVVCSVALGSGAHAPALLALGGAWALTVGTDDGRAAMVLTAAALVAIDQLVRWADDARSGCVERGPDLRARAGRVLALVLGAAVLAALVVGAGELPVPGGLAGEGIGLAAAVATLALVAARRWDR